MSGHGRRPPARRRFGRAATHATTAAARVPEVGATLDRILALPRVDRMLGWLLDRPRAVQFAGILIGIVLVALALRPLIWPVDRPTTPAASSSGAAPVSAPVTVPLAQSAANSSEDEVVHVVAAYNQASIAAAALGRPDPMAPYLAPDGSSTWAEIQAEYQRRARRGESHEPALTRWGVLRIAVHADSATVETQEQWDDVTSIGGQVIGSRRGILTRNTYTLRRAVAPPRWLITDVATTAIIT